jgi:hypothetical protein
MSLGHCGRDLSSTGKSVVRLWKFCSFTPQNFPQLSGDYIRNLLQFATVSSKRQHESFSVSLKYRQKEIMKKKISALFLAILFSSTIVENPE